jgi:hypothetical protein
MRSKVDGSIYQSPITRYPYLSWLDLRGGGERWLEKKNALPAMAPDIGGVKNATGRAKKVIPG